MPSLHDIKTPTTEEEVSDVAGRVTQHALAKGLPTRKCILFPVRGQRGLVVPVLLDRVCKRPTAIDLDVDVYLHRNQVAGWRVRFLGDGSFVVHEFPPGTDIAPSFKFRFFFTSREQDSRVRLDNRPLTLLAGTTEIRFWNNLLVCKLDSISGVAVDVEEGDVQLVAYMLLFHAAKVDLNQL
ncbi:hypothetical protein BKA70DRAFT_1433625 [Coprinopsis sp. MPI-PUGE-AT-0042]|nr:hypothetical protein BKA70DRAFT_1433625 [Coprinopsis sp. MPI-PUGE-AT-0042]